MAQDIPIPGTIALTFLALVQVQFGRSAKMPRSKNPENYPATYKALLESAGAVPDGLRVKFSSRADMMRTRASLYAYINAVAFQEDEANVDYEFRKSPDYRQVMLKPEGYELLLMHKRYTPESECIERALANLGVSTPLDTTPPIDDAITAAQAAIDAAELSEDAPPIESADPHADLISNLFNKGK
jgi:hypothetical protein